MLDASGIQHLPRSPPSTTRLWILSGKWSNLEVQRRTAPFTVNHQRASKAVPCKCCQAPSSSAPTAEFVTPTLALHRLWTQEPLPSARHSHCLRRTRCLNAGLNAECSRLIHIRLIVFKFFWEVHAVIERTKCGLAKQNLYIYFFSLFSVAVYLLPLKKWIFVFVFLRW